jgi:hypothetical protein
LTKANEKIAPPKVGKRMRVLLAVQSEVSGNTMFEKAFILESAGSSQLWTQAILSSCAGGKTAWAGWN